MKISLAWLNEYIDIQEFFQKPQELAQLLTSVGLEVEGIENPGVQFQHVVIGEIIEKAKHPNAEKLTLCQVNVGEGPNRQIICGAKNHNQGDHVVVALPGAVLPGDFAIKISKIRDVESQGMLCSESELGLQKKSEGIIILPKSAKVGQTFADYQGLNDIILELNVTPNRADCLSHIGLAREISSLLERPLRLPKVELKTGLDKTKDMIQLKVEDSEACPRYCGRGVFGVKIGESPTWLKNRLTAIGMNSINNVVDVTNFVMMEYGQPLHAFDADELNGKKIFVRPASTKEKFTTFDGTELTFSGEELTIRDGDRTVALAGVIGGLNSGVTEKTKNIFLEAAHFNPRVVRRSARRHGIETDSSQRFSRGTDPVHVEDVMNRAVGLIQDVAGGLVASDHYDVQSEKFVASEIAVRLATLNDRLGYAITLKDFAAVMKRLHCGVKIENEKAIVTPPPFRFDLNIEMDFVEEYARINGYEKIPETFPVLENPPTDSAVSFEVENRVAEMMRREGFYEAKNYNFVSEKWQSALIQSEIFEKLGLKGVQEPVAIRNPLSEETGHMRQSLLPGLIQNMLHNYHYGMASGRLFEIGYAFGKKSDGEYFEGHRLAGVLWGQQKGLWQADNSPVVLKLKATLEGLATQLNSAVYLRSVEKASVPGFIHGGQMASLFYEGQTIGFIGALHPQLREEKKVRCECAVFELDLSLLMRGQPRLPKLKKMSRYPAVERDLAFIVPDSVPAGELLKDIAKAAGPILQSVAIFDVFKGPGVPGDSQSIAYKIIFQDMETTLSEDKLKSTIEQILGVLKKKGIEKRA